MNGTPLRQALAEDCRRLGLILLAAGIVSGLLQGHIPSGYAIYASLAGVGFAILGYSLHFWEQRHDRLYRD
jgi:membrane associated rhomboid family serine protease